MGGIPVHIKPFGSRLGKHACLPFPKIDRALMQSHHVSNSISYRSILVFKLYWIDV